jgi:hypothetical protein
VTVATLLDPSADVHVRGSRELIWKPATDRMPLADKDAVKTGKSSSAWVRFNDLTRLKLDELSMMIVVGHGAHAVSNQSSVALPSGTVDGKLDPDPERPVELEVRTARGWIRASTRAGKHSATKFRVALDPKGALEVRNDAGDIKVVTKGHEQALKAHEVFSAQPAPGEPAPGEPAPTSDTFAEPPAVEPASIKVAADPKYEPPTAAPAAPPKRFQILKPSPRAVVQGESVTVEGLLAPHLKAFLNGVEVKAGENGHFSIPFHLNPGVNVLTFQIIGKAGDSGDEQVQYQTLEVTRK